MPATKPKSTVTLDALAALISHTAASADTKFAALAEDIADIKSSMATKDDIADLKSEMTDRFEHVDDQLRDITSEIAVIHRRIGRLEEQGASNAGFAKEIDHLLARVAEIEQHLGLNKKAAA
jgi:predicted  nucleic acid-binding Zn-ribbon protein